MQQRSRNGVYLSLLGAGFFAYLAQPLVFSAFGDNYLLIGLSFLATAIPALLWLVADRLINDNETTPIWLLVLTAAYLCLWYIGDLQLLGASDTVTAQIFFELLPQLIKLGLIGHVIAMAIAGRSTDLVAKRLRLRTPLALAASAIVATVILVELWASNDVPMMLEAVGSVFMFFTALAANLFLLRWRGDFSLASVTAPSKPAQSPDEDEHIRQAIALIENSMTQERFYAGHGKTLTDLAQQLNMTPHRLRTLINQYMGYKNFNQFLNHYRIEEAAARLHSQPELPILSIALDVGFKSISSFNAAFKAAYHSTPTEYRSTKPSPS